MVGLWVEPGTSAMQLYSNTKLTVAVVKSHSKACSACTLLFSVNNYERFLYLTVLTVNSSAAILNPTISLWLFKATKYIIFINVTPRWEKRHFCSKHLRSNQQLKQQHILKFTVKVSDCTKHCFGFKFPSIKHYSVCYWIVIFSPLVNQVMKKNQLVFPATTYEYSYVLPRYLEY